MRVEDVLKWHGVMESKKGELYPIYTNQTLLNTYLGYNNVYKKDLTGYYHFDYGSKILRRLEYDINGTLIHTIKMDVGYAKTLNSTVSQKRKHVYVFKPSECYVYDYDLVLKKVIVAPVEYNYINGIDEEQELFSTFNTSDYTIRIYNRDVLLSEYRASSAWSDKQVLFMKNGTCLFVNNKPGNSNGRLHMYNYHTGDSSGSSSIPLDVYGLMSKINFKEVQI